VGLGKHGSAYSTEAPHKFIISITLLENHWTAICQIWVGSLC